MPANHNIPHTSEAKAKMSAAHKGIPLFHKRRPSKIEKGIEVFRCGSCGEFFPRGGFYKNKRTLLGLTSECRKCHAQTAIKSRNPETSKANKRRNEARRRARKFAASGNVSTKDLRVLEILWGGACLKCGNIKNLQWDHVVPLARGGDHSIGNLQRLCRNCNERKQARTADYRTRGQKLWVIEFKVVHDG